MDLTKNALLRAAMLAALIVLTTLAADAAAEPTPADRVTARALFDQARKLASEGKYAEAVPKFEESQRLDPGIGTQFNLADCLERSGRTATAWAMFLDVASAAKQAGQKDREKVARDRAAALEPKLSRLSVSVATEVPGLEIKRDGSALGKVLWGTSVPVDPGSHTIEASAPGMKKWVHSVQVAADAAETKVTVPALEPEGAAASPPPPATAPPPSPPPAASPSPQPEPSIPPPAVTTAPTAKQQAKPGSAQRVAGLVVGVAGLVGAGVAGYLTVSAKSKVSDSNQYCSSKTECYDERGVTLRDDAMKQADIATIVGSIGAVALVGGVVLYLTAPSGKSAPASAARTAPVLAVGPTGFTLKGAW